MNVQITFRDFPPSEAIRQHVEKRAQKLERSGKGIVSSRVTVAAPHRHHKHGRAYRVSIDVVFRAFEVVVSPRDGVPGHTDLHAAIDDAFDDAERQLREREAKRVRKGGSKLSFAH